MTVAKTTPAPLSPPCPNGANHTWSPQGYLADSNWAEGAALVADQSQCGGCGFWLIWTPKRADLRPLTWDAGPSCATTTCQGDSVAEKFCEELGWRTVCVTHTGMRPEGGGRG